MLRLEVYAELITSSGIYTKFMFCSLLSFNFFIFLLSGEVYAWGDNDEGQLGDGTTNAIQRPRVVASLQGENSKINYIFILSPFIFKFVSRLLKY